GTVENDIGLVDREHRVAGRRGFCRQVAMAVDRYQTRHFCYLCGSDVKSICQPGRPGAPLWPPEIVVLNVKLDALEGPRQLSFDIRRHGLSPIGKPKRRRQGGAKERT